MIIINREGMQRLWKLMGDQFTQKWEIKMMWRTSTRFTYLNVDVDEESSDLVLNSEPIDWNSGGGRSDQAVDVETDTLILINPRGGVKSDQT